MCSKRDSYTTKNYQYKIYDFIREYYHNRSNYSNNTDRKAQNSIILTYKYIYSS